MSFIDLLTPGNTEEVRPGIFIQEDKGSYRTINPLAWKGKFRTREQLRTVFSVGTVIRIFIIVFIVWAYLNDTAEYRGFYNTVISNPVAWCNNVLSSGEYPTDLSNFTIGKIRITDEGQSTTGI